MKDWADIEAEREVDALTPSVPPMARAERLSDDVGGVVTIHGRPLLPAWVAEVMRAAQVIGVSDQIHYNGSVECFVLTRYGQIIVTRERWMRAQRECVAALEALRESCP